MIPAMRMSDSMALSQAGPGRWRQNRFYVLLSGKVKLGHASADGRENLLAVLGPGEVVGELTLFDPGPRSTTVTAVVPTWSSRHTPRSTLGRMESSGMDK